MTELRAGKPSHTQSRTCVKHLRHADCRTSMVSVTRKDIHWQCTKHEAPSILQLLPTLL